MCGEMPNSGNADILTARAGPMSRRLQCTDKEPWPSGAEIAQATVLPNSAVLRLQAFWRGRLARRQQDLARRCFCGQLRSYCKMALNGDGTSNHDYFCGLHKGLWRGYGLWVPRTRSGCCQSAPDTCDLRITRMCVPEWLTHHPRPWNRCGRQRWLNVSHEFVPISEHRGDAFEEVFELFNEYQAERDPSKVLSRRDFIDLYCTSPVGSISADAATQLTRAVQQQLESKGNDSYVAFPDQSSLVGTCFSLLRWQGRVIGCMLLDIGPTFVATKIFWYDVADASRGSSGAYGRSIIDIMWFKHLMLAGNLGNLHLWNGYSDPRLPRMCYKLERFFDYSEAQCAEGWLPLAVCIERNADGTLRWSSKYGNPTKLL